MQNKIRSKWNIINKMKKFKSNEMDNIFDFNINQELDEKKEFENDNSFYSFDLKLFNPFEEIVELKDYEMNFW